MGILFYCSGIEGWWNPDRRPLAPRPNEVLTQTDEIPLVNSLDLERVA